jgi:pyruvate formate lyase activating enzyme
MIVAGLQKTTLIDYPGKIACVVFLAMCNFRCPWCYSSELVLPLKIAKQPKISEKEFFDFLRQRQGLLEGVVICGGEPTVNKDLPNFIEKIKKSGFFVKLDTNGSNPKMLKDLVRAGFIDYVAMDIKGPMGPNFQLIPTGSKQSIFNFKKILGEGAKIEDIQESARFLKLGSVDFEFRTTCVPKVHEKDDFFKIAEWIGGENVKYFLQSFRPEKTIDPEFEKIKPFENKFLEDIAKEISPHFKICQLR